MTVFGRIARLVRRIDQRWCAPKFAQRLGPRLLRDYGASKFYSAGQIRAACAKCRLPRRQLALAYAPFLPPTEFENTADADFQALRKLYFRFTGEGEDFSVAPASVNVYVAQFPDPLTGMGGNHPP